MKRRVVLILLLLVAGAIVNVAVAWTLARFVHNYQGTWNERAMTGKLPAQSPCWLVVIRRGFGTLYITGAVRDWSPGDSALDLNTLPSWSNLLHHPPTTDDAFRRIEQVRGWPCLAMKSERTRWTDGRAPDQVVGGVDLGPYVDWATPVTNQSGLGAAHWLDLPFHPIWPGFAINTVFYAFILWLLFAAPFALRWRMRIKRGLCPKCAYPVGDSPRCTECGEIVDVGRAAVFSPSNGST